MIERIVLTIALLLLGAIVFHMVTQWQLQRMRQQATSDGVGQAGVPTILYFTTPTCGICRLQLVPRLEQLQTEVGEDNLQITGIDITQNWEAAEQWQIFSVPTTVVLDAAGQPIKVFQGMMQPNDLRATLETI